MRIRITLARILAGGVLAGTLAAFACSSSSGHATPCNEDPTQCSTGQTCWPNCVCPSGQTPCTADNCTVQFACIASAPGVSAGDNCGIQIGNASCGDDQACVSFADAGPGTCRTYCDPNGGCAMGETCAKLQVGSSTATESVCLPPGVQLDAGLMVDGGFPSSSSGGEPSDAALDWWLDVAFDGGPPLEGGTQNK